MACVRKIRIPGKAWTVSMVLLMNCGLKGGTKFFSLYFFSFPLFYTDSRYV